MKKLVTIAVAAMLAMTAQAAQVGDYVESIVSIDERVEIAPQTITVLTQMSLEDGFWSISGSINLFVKGTDGKIVYYAGGIEPQPTLDAADGRTVFGSRTIWNGRTDPPIPVVSRVICVQTPPYTTKPIYLTTWVVPEGFTPQTIQAYGFIGATKIKNNY